MFAFCFIFSAFWAVAPVAGWGRFDVSPAGITCTIDWTIPDATYVSYITSYTTWAYLIPFAPTVYFYRKTYLFLKANPEHEVEWAARSRVGTVILGCALATYVSFGGYGAVCLVALFVDYRSFPSGVNVLPPLFSKMAGLFNPIFYLWLNPRLQTHAFKILGWGEQEGWNFESEGVFETEVETKEEPK